MQFLLCLHFLPLPTKLTMVEIARTLYPLFSFPPRTFTIDALSYLYFSNLRIPHLSSA